MLPAGPSWCDQFPTSISLDDLAEPFQSQSRAFIASLEARGCSIKISATYRPPERAYLMHWCAMIAESKQDPAAVPSMTGVDIQWDLGDPAKTRAASKAMMQGYGIVYPPALVSRHTQRLAIDMTITPMPEDAIEMGAAFGVIKLVSDPPHWSSDGH